MKKRQELICWKPDCKEQFSVLLPHAEISRFIAVCPYCGIDCVLILKDCPRKMVVYRQGTSDSEMATEYDLPEVMETCKQET
jgi:hypothetical protein